VLILLPHLQDFNVSTTETSPPETAPAAASPATPGWHDQDGLLRDMWLRNQSPQAIAAALGRSVPAIMTRAARLGLPRRSAPGRKPILRTEKDTSGVPQAAAVRTKPATTQAQETSPQTSLRVCLMCLNKFESAGRHNRICSSCKNSAEYESASALPDIDLPVT
jgi:hypothetical protein